MRYNGGMRGICKILFFIGGALLGGCASLDDFRGMSPSERADYVCDRHYDVKQLDAEIAAAESEIADISAALARGFRLHRYCKQIPVKRKTREKCSTEQQNSESGGGEVEVCEEISEIKHEEFCEDIPVPIDGEFERDKRDRRRGELRNLENELARVFTACTNEVRQMSAERAFDYYQSHRGGIF